MPEWRDALAQFEAYLERSGLAQSTIVGYVRDVESFFIWLVGCAERETSPVAFSSDDVEAYKRHLHDVAGRSPASVNRCLQSLRKFGRFMVRRDGHKANPAQRVALFKPPAFSSSQALNDEEVQRLIGATEVRRSRTATRDYAILQLLLQTGIRASELVHLRLEDVEWLEGHGVLLVRGRGKRPARRLPLNELACRALRTYLDQPRLPGASYLFLSRGSEPLSIRSVQQIVANLGRAAGLDISVRTLRDTYARSLWRSTGDLDLLARYLGHKRLESVLRYISPPRGHGDSPAVAEGDRSSLWMSESGRSEKGVHIL